MKKKGSRKGTSQDGTERLKPHRFQKGVSGNPKGRPKKLPKLEKILAHLLGEMTENGESEMQEILKNLIREAKDKRVLSKNTQAAKILLEYAYGLPEKKQSDKEVAPITWQEQKTYEAN